jgi:hypothetical protein
VLFAVKDLRQRINDFVVLVLLLLYGNMGVWRISKILGVNI